MPPLSHVLLVAIAATVGFVWGLSEIVGAFKFDTHRALGTGGAWLLLLTNAFAAGCIYLFVASLIPGLDEWYAALMMGLAWPTVIRNANIKLAASMQAAPSINEAGDREAASIRFEQIYANFQNVARQMINASLTRQRMKLVTRSARLDLAKLESHARLLLIASPLQGDGMPGSAFIDEIMKRPDADEMKKALLAVFILTQFGRDALDEFIRQQGRRPGANASS